MSFRMRHVRQAVAFSLVLGILFGGCTGNVNRGSDDIFMVTLVSQTSGGIIGTGDSSDPSISANGRFIAFVSTESLVPGVGIGVGGPTEQHIYVRDTILGTTQLVTWKHDNTSAVTFSSPHLPHSKAPSISGDGRYVAFQSWATGLVLGMSEGNSDDVFDVFIRDRDPDGNGIFEVGTGRNYLVSASSANPLVSGNLISEYPSVSSDGRLVSFQSKATDLVVGFDENNYPNHPENDVFVCDLDPDGNGKIDGGNWVTGLVSMNFDNNGGGDQESRNPSISKDGRFIAFESGSTDLVSPSPPLSVNVYVRDRVNGMTKLIKCDAYGNSPVFPKNILPALSKTGRFVVFRSEYVSFIPLTGQWDFNSLPDLYVVDLAGVFEGSGDQILTRVSVPTNGMELLDGVGGTPVKEYAPSISGDGRFVVFASSSVWLTLGAVPPFSDNNGEAMDIFRHDRHTGETLLLSKTLGGQQGIFSSDTPVISEDGRNVVFLSQSANFVSNDDNVKRDVFVWSPQ